MGYSLVIGTVSHEEAWSEVMPDIVQSFVKNMVSCLGGREGGREGGEEGGRRLPHASTAYGQFMGGMGFCCVRVGHKGNPHPCPSLQSHHVDRDTQEMSAGRFTVWLQHHCPRLLEGVQQWLLYLLHGHALTQGAGQEEVLHM